ncbi:hypothetical protein BOSE62_130670 [Bosea sp. 62]|uniref:hypothetical protein n=1 Tax=unclassified Bosea (in: a-proteobacteria) TaxID=2653178 RepID=UPI001255F15E|nr:MULTISPECIES: hypothetical protein [unclassified Bosea (in: a-proteobacteria)]CAD5255764.1 hypothetical protein BOSE7B_120690 [Bosea sp. 7B]CAD5275008.1 hypothetical protein BOSE21B_30222 [Bosea sp. 21B]CAD5276150.1 hypothetical protein BOSE46_30083 [Bosea sp. 46]VVT60039.1 hypothetical protein BOS5A_210830 [Bosea sp. EC-HK365B]VXB52712.1 hypothetical protein BOSE62_130670 [Bosea sp. 62]
MHLSIMALRLAVKAALAPYWPDGATVSWPTIAADRFFDSRFDQIDGRGGERTPLVVFAAEATEGDAFSGQNGAHAERGFDLTARLVISAQITSRQKFTDPETEQEFDAEAADLLDQEMADHLALLQDQIWLVIEADPLVRKLRRRIVKLDAEPYPSTETGEKLAVLATSYFVAPLDDGEKALQLVVDGLPAASPERKRAEFALGGLASTRAFLAAAVQRRSGFAPGPFSAGLVAQGVSQVTPAPGPSTPPEPPADRLSVTLDPKEPLP